MDQDIKMKRASYIDKSTDIREMFAFADPVQVLGAVETYCGDHYGAMLWNLWSPAAGKYFRCWNTCVKLAWDVPRGTHTYFVTNLLAGGFLTVRTKLMTRFVKFFRSLLASVSPEVALVANIVGRDMGSTTGINLFQLRQETGLNPWSVAPAKVRQALMEREHSVPETDEWRLPLFEQYLKQPLVMLSATPDEKVLYIYAKI